MESARVLAQEPTVAILDDTTSALDAKTEEQVMNNIRNAGVTCIVIAQAFTVRECEEIVVLDKGLWWNREPMKTYTPGGKYARLVSSE